MEIPEESLGIHKEPLGILVVSRHADLLGSQVRLPTSLHHFFFEPLVVPIIWLLLFSSLESFLREQRILQLGI